MCRFNDAGSQAYRGVEDAIVSFIHNATAAAPQISNSVPKDGAHRDQPLLLLGPPPTEQLIMGRRRALNEWLDPSPTIDTFHHIKREKAGGFLPVDLPERALSAMAQAALAGACVTWKVRRGSASQQW